MCSDIDSVSKFLAEQEAIDEEARLKAWVDSIRRGVVETRPAYDRNVASLANVSCPTRLMPTGEDPNEALVAFAQGERDAFAQVVMHYRDDVVLDYMYVRDMYYWSRMFLCAIERGRVHDLYECIRDVYDATTDKVSRDVVNMIRRHSEDWGVDAPYVNNGLVHIHYGFVAEENFVTKSGAPSPLGKSLKLRCVARLVEDKAPLDVVCRECVGVPAAVIQSDCERFGIERDAFWRR